MCELMGLSFARPVSADFSIHEFALRSEQNADGWGLAWYPDRSVAVVKEPVRWQASQYTRFLETYQNLQSRVYIAHVRHKTTGGEATHADTHPFAREWAGWDFCFAHNGTLQGDFWQLPLGRFKPVGGTDSEFLFCNLLDEVSRRDELLDTEPSWRRLSEKLAAVNRWGKLNVLLSDGERLFCYLDAAAFKGLNFREIYIQDNEIRRFEDAGLRMDLAGKAANRGFVIATTPLSSTGWQPFQPGELIVFERGELRFSSRRAAPIGR